MDRQARALVGKGSELYIVDQGGQYQKQVLLILEKPQLIKILRYRHRWDFSVYSWISGFRSHSETEKAMKMVNTEMHSECDFSSFRIQGKTVLPMYMGFICHSQTQTLKELTASILEKIKDKNTQKVKNSAFQLDKTKQNNLQFFFR